MSLDQIVKAIVDDADASPYLRAIRLYELQVAIFYPRSFRALIAATNDARGANKRLRTARIYAGIKFLEHIEAELRGTLPTGNLSIRDLAQNRGYQEIFDSVIAANGGWSRIRHSISVKAFEKNISEQRVRASAVAKIIDFSYRFSGIHNPKGYLGGVHTARHVVRTAISYDSRMSKTLIKNRWRYFKCTAPFLYLLLIQNFPLMPPRLFSKSFLKQLLEQAQNIEGLRNFFRAYQHVCDVLTSRQYSFERLTLNLYCDVPSMATAAFQSDVIAAFEKPKEEGEND
jgi:hypothetical protein